MTRHSNKWYWIFNRPNNYFIDKSVKIKSVDLCWSIPTLCNQSYMFFFWFSIEENTWEYTKLSDVRIFFFKKLCMQLKLIQLHLNIEKSTCNNCNSREKLQFGIIGCKFMNKAVNICFCHFCLENPITRFVLDFFF